MQKKKCSRKILAVMLSVVLVLSVLPLFTLTASADNPKIVVESKSAERGSDVEINISLENNPGIASLKLSVSFPEGITLKSASYNSEQLGGTATPVANYESPVILNWISPLSNVTGDIIFATLTFTADGAAALGDKSITVSYNQADVYDVFGEDVAFETESGKITVIPCSHPGTVIKSAVAATCTEAGYTGDTHCVKCDEILSYGSVIDALGHNYEAVVTAPTFTAQGYTTYTCSRCGDSYISDYTDPKVLGDVNRDGFIDNKDLTRFYQYLSGQSVTVDETVMDLDESGTITNSDMLMLFIDLTNTHESTVSNIPGAESAPRIAVESKSVHPGESFDTRILVKNNPGVSSIKLEITYPEGLVLNDVIFANDIGDFYRTSASVNSPVILNFISPLEEISDDFALATLKFTVSGTVSPGEKDIVVAYKQANIYNSLEQDVAFATENGIITVGACQHTQTEIRDAVAATYSTEGYTGDTYCLICGQKISEGAVIPRETMKITVENVTTEVGKTVSLRIFITNNPGIISMKVKVAFPEGITLNKPIVYNTAQMGGQAVPPQNTNSPATLNWQSPFANVAGDYTFATLSFTVGNSVAPGDYDITLTCDQADIFNLAEDDVLFTIQNGKITVAPCAHENTTVYPAVASTCTVQGHDGYEVCNVCGAIINGSDALLPLDTTNHTGETEVRNAASATCTEAGYTGDTYCLSCNTKIEYGTIIPALGHTGGTATCHSKAVCTRCGEEYSEFDANNHDGATEIRDASAATCTAAGYTGDTYCLGCNQKIANGEVTAALGHNYASIITAPTCTEQGYTTYTCSHCGDSYVADYTAALGHTGGTATCHSKAVCTRCGEEYGEFDASNHDGATEIRDASAATCTAAGYTGDTYCLGCNQKIASGEVTAALGHDYAAVVTAPTCTEGGYTTYTCSRCGGSYVADNTAALGHTGGTATCHSKAVCTRCGEEYGEFDASNHDGATEVRDASAATCTAAGYTGDTYCLGCNQKIASGEVITALGHDYAAVVTAPTCTAGGYTTYTCSHCGDSYVADYTAALGHTGGTATCHSKAVCTRCGEEYSEFDANNHDGATEIRNASAATCTAAGYTGDTYCLGCNQKIANGEVTAALGHDYAAVVTAPTCTAGGYTTYTCSRCGDSYVDTYTDAVGHTAGDWEADADNHWHICTACGEKLDEAAHTESDWIIDVEATMYAAGSKHKECTVCGKVLQTEIIPDTHVPGDINGDGVLNNKDLNRLFQYLSDWDVTVLETALDVNGDGTVNNKDLNRLFQYLSDWDVEIY